MDIGSLTGSIELEDNLSSGMSIAAAHVKSFASNFDGMVGTVLVGAGLAATAIASIGAAIVGLGNRGSDINDVRQTLEHFAGSAEAASEIVSRMSQGVLGTVTNFELAGTAAKLLSANVKLSSDEFGTLSEAAFVLQNRGLGTTKQMMDLVSDALITGRTRTLALKLGVIEVKDAEADFAKSLGVTKDQLSQSGIVEARRIAIMKMLKSAVADAGQQERDFGELIEAGITKLRNWGDELASRVAKSQSVINAVKAIGSALSDAFGGSSEAALRTIVGWIDRFADAVTHYGPIIIRWVGDIIRWIQGIVARVQQYWDTVPDWFKNIAKEAVVTAGVVYVSAKSLDALSVAAGGTGFSIADLATTISGTRDSVLSLIEVQRAWGRSFADYFSNWAKVIPQIRQVGVLTAVVSTAQAAWAGIMGSTLVTALTGLGSAIGAFLISPLGLVVVAITGVVAALRIISGSWDFITVPARMAWQTLKDVWTITGELASLLGDMLEPALSSLGGVFDSVSSIIKNGFVVALQQARQEYELLVNLVKENVLSGALQSLELIRAAAEFIRWRQSKEGAAAITGIGQAIPVGTLTPLTVLPGATNIVPPTDVTQVPRTAGREESNFLKGSTAAEDYARKVQNLLETLRTAGDDVRAFEDAFKKLTATQLASADVQQALVTHIDALRNAHRDLTPQMIEVRNAAMATRLAYQEQDMEMLALQEVTLSQIDHMKRLGMSTEDIAQQFGVASSSIDRYVDSLQEAATNAQNLASFENALREQQERDRQRREDVFIDGNKRISDAEKELNDFIRQQSTSTTQFQIEKIHEEENERINAFSVSRRSAAQVKAFTDLMKRQSNERINALIVDNEALKNHSRQTLQEIADRAKATYEKAKADVQGYGAAAVSALDDVREAAERAARGFLTFSEIVGDALKQIPDLLIDAFVGGGDLLGAIKAMAVSLGREFGKTLSASVKESFRVGVTGLTATAKAASAGVGAISGAAAVAAGNTAAQAIGAVGLAAASTAIATASAAAAAGATGAAMTSAALAAGAWTFGIGAAAVGVALLIKHFFTISKAVKEARKNLDDFSDLLHQTLTDQQRASAGGDKWAMTMIAVREAYILVGKSVAEAEDAVRRLHDTGRPAISAIATAEIAHNVAISENIKGVRSLIQEYIGAGETIPAALQKKIDKLVIMGKLTAENATEILKLTKDAVPSYAEVTAAAERYGIQVASLGSAVQGLRIAETAQQIITDWNLLTKAGADVNVVIAGMKDELQAVITDSLKFGTALPKQLEPIIRQFIEAGGLVDEFGNALTDTSRLTFAETLVEKIEKLVDAMLAFTDAITGSGDALDELAGRTITIPIRYSSPDFEGPLPNADDVSFNRPSFVEAMEPSYYAHGKQSGQGSRNGNLVAFIPRGTDVHPAMIGTEERVLTAAEARNYEEAVGGTAIIEVEGQELARILLPKWRHEVKRHRLARR